MKDLQGKSTTELRVNEVRYNVAVPDALFDPATLSTAASSPAWQNSSVQAAKNQELNGLITTVDAEGATKETQRGR